MLPLQLMSNFPPQIRATPFLIGGSISWHGENDGLPISAQPWLFNQQHLSISMTDGQIERLEQKRAGGQAMFDLRLRGLGSINGAISVISTTHTPTIIIPRDEWVRVLAMMGHGTRRLIELPPPPSGVGGEWDAAAERIVAGSARLAAGDASVAIAEARTATERLIEAIGGIIGRPRNGALKPFAEGLAKALRERHVDRSDDAFAVMAKAVELAIEIFGFASEPGHNGFVGSDRRDAELALGLATTLYSYFSGFPQRPEVHRVAADAGA